MFPVPPEFTHVDDWLDNFSIDESKRYAQFVIFHMRLPSAERWAFEPYMKEFPLFATYKGKKYKVTMASRMGDIGLSENLEAQNGYNIRVWVDQITDWHKE